MIVAVIIAALAVPTAEPGIDFSGVQEDLASPPTEVLVLGTSHLNQLPEEAFEPAHLALVLDRLEAFNPDTIAIEAVGGRTCDELRRYGDLYVGVADRYCRDPSPALEALGLTQPEAYLAAQQQVRALAETPSPAERRRLSLLLFAAGEPWSAAVQWAYLDPTERTAEDDVTAELKERFDRLLESRNENNLIGVALATRLGVQRLTAMDDHSADGVYAFASEDLGPVIQAVWSTNVPGEDEQRAQAHSYLGSAEGVLAGCRFLNSEPYQQNTIDSDFGLAAATPDHDGVARQYVGWWQIRNLRMAANIVEAASNEPGARVLVIVGASHKAYLDAYLDQMHDWALIDVDAVMHD